MNRFAFSIEYVTDPFGPWFDWFLRPGGPSQSPVVVTPQEAESYVPSFRKLMCNSQLTLEMLDEIDLAIDPWPYPHPQLEPSFFTLAHITMSSGLSEAETATFTFDRDRFINRVSKLRGNGAYLRTSRYTPPKPEDWHAPHLCTGPYWRLIMPARCK